MQFFHSFFPKISETSWQRLCRYREYLQEWNAKINLISRKETDFFIEKHLLPIMALTEWEEGAAVFQKNTKVLDVGTGGGIPGIPLAICFPNSSFTLLDSIHKKTRAVEDMVQNLRLTNARVVCERCEEHPGKYDICVGRGVMAFEDFIQTVSSVLKPKGSVFYWSGGNFEELVPKKLQKQVRAFDLEAFFQGKYGVTKKILWYSKIF